MAEPEAFAIGPNEQCATVAANKVFTDGRPIHWQDSTTYGSASCTNAYVVDVTYSALAPLPGTYLSWADDEPERRECRGLERRAVPGDPKERRNARLAEISCPAYTLGPTKKTYSCTPGSSPLTSQNGAGYCLLNERNDRTYKRRVFKLDSSSKLVVIGYLPVGKTGRRTWGCMDGLCDGDVRVATQYTMPTQAERDFVGTAFGFVRSTRPCLDSVAATRRS